MHEYYKAKSAKLKKTMKNLLALIGRGDRKRMRQSLRCRV